MIMCNYILFSFYLIIQIVKTTNKLKDIDWNIVNSSINSQTEVSVPRGCKCDQNIKEGEICLIFDCSCQCDLTAGACDPLCCCDLECANDHVEYIKSLGLCEASRPNDPTSTTCEKSSQVNINPKHRLSYNITDEFTCVIVDNSGIKAKYFQEPSYSSTHEALLKNKKLYSYLTKSSIQKSPTTSEFYKTGDNMLATIKKDDGSFVHAYGGVLPLPIPSSLFSECFDQNPAQYDLAVSDSQCSRKIDDLEADCSSILSYSRFVSDLYVGKKPSSSFDSSSSDDYLNIQLGSVQQYSFEDGTYTDLSSSLPSYVEEMSAEYDSASKTCKGSLIELVYLVYHDGKGLIDSIFANVVIADIKSTEIIYQKYSINYINSSPSFEPKYELNNLLSLKRSGNPGYLQSYLLRLGKLIQQEDANQNGDLQITEDTLSAISEVENGFKLLKPGECSSIGSDAIRFGEDTRSSCTLKLDLDAFKNFCTTTIIPDVLKLDIVTHVAKFGSSDPLSPEEWVKIEKDAFVTEAGGVYTSTTGECSNLVTSLNLEFLVAKVGSKTNPQLKITQARAKYHKTSWKFWLGTPMAEQTFILQTSVSFIYAESKEPEIWFGTDGDILYPFTTSSHDLATSSSIKLSYPMLLSFITYFLYLNKIL